MEKGWSFQKFNDHMPNNHNYYNDDNVQLDLYLTSHTKIN